MIELIDTLNGVISNEETLTGLISVGTKINTQEKTTYSSFEQQEIIPDENYYLSKVIVEAMPYDLTPNEYGGLTLTIGE